jgi:hypothetical protein
MTSESAQEQEERDDPFASLYSYEFVLLTTFRKNSTGVLTAMWFAHEQDRLSTVMSSNTTNEQSCCCRSGMY